MEIGILAAFVAGLVSFLSPCVLPLVPGYISMLSGIGIEQLKQGEAPRGGLLASSLAFILGFSVVFIAFGASASAVGQFLLQNRSVLTPIAGALVILFGLHLVGWLGKMPRLVAYGVGVALAAAAVLWAALSGGGLTRAVPRLGLLPIHLLAASLIFLAGPPLSGFFNREARLHDVGQQPGVVGGFLMGFAFAFGWTPCIGPILAGVLAIAATQETVGRGVFLLAVYSAGLAIPFLLTTLGLGGFLRFYQNFRKHLHTVEVGSGILLLLVGGLIFTERLGWLSQKFAFLNAVEEKVAQLVGMKGPGGGGRAANPKNANLPDAPDVEFKDLEGRPVRLADFRGQVVLVNFWATWCNPCRVEIPWFIEFQQQYGDRGFVMLGVSMDEEGAAVVRPWLEKERFEVNGVPTAINYKMVLGNDSIAEQFGGLLGLPTSLLITRDGKIAIRFIGLVSHERIVKEIEANLE
jgi:cytochrome c-type biogenesis protein